MRSKPFDPQLHKENDAEGKIAAMQALSVAFPDLHPIPAEDNISNQTYTDIYLCNDAGDVVHNAEVEIKHFWKDGNKPFPSSRIHIPSRKMKRGYQEVDIHAIISKDRNGIFLVTRNIVKQAFRNGNVVIKNCKNHNEPEEFVSILTFGSMPGRTYMRRKNRESPWQKWNGN